MQTINLNQNSFRLFPTIYMVQNDTGRELKMILDDVTLAGTETGAVAIKRSDGSYYTIPATIVTGENAFTADMSQALTQPRQTECQLKVTASDDSIISSYTFCIMVQPSTDGISEEQLGYSVQQLRQDAADIRAGGLPADLRAALLQIAEKVAYIDGNGAQYYQDLYDALGPSAILTGITAVYTQSGAVYTTDALDSLKADLVVTASYSDGTTQTVQSSDYTLSGTLTVGTSMITVTYQDKTTTFTVTVSAPALYPLPAGNKTFMTAGTMTISDGNHLAVSGNPYSISASGTFWDISNVTKSNNGSSAAVNNLTNTYFSVPNGATVVLSVSNLQASDASLWTSNTANISIGLRKKGTNSSLCSIRLQENTSVTVTATADTDISCVMFYGASVSANMTYSFDISVTVNGDRYI